MGRSAKRKDEGDAAALEQLRALLAEAAKLATGLQNVSAITLAVLHHGLATAAEQARQAHEQAHFGATGKLLWNGRCYAGEHGLDREGQACDQCALEANGTGERCGYCLELLKVGDQIRQYALGSIHDGACTKTVLEARELDGECVGSSVVTFKGSTR
jgi:hypothetical protein